MFEKLYRPQIEAILAKQRFAETGVAEVSGQVLRSAPRRLALITILRNMDKHFPAREGHCWAWDSERDVLCVMNESGGLSVRARMILQYAGVAEEESEIRRAIETGALRVGRTRGLGVNTFAEILSKFGISKANCG